MKNIIQNIRRELKQNIDLNYKKGTVNFFKEPIKPYVVRSKAVHKIALKYFNEINNNWFKKRLFPRSFKKSSKIKKDFFTLCEELLKSNYHEEAIIVFIWTEKLVNNFDLADFKIFENWLVNYVNNWAKCDAFCTHTINYFVQNYPAIIPEIKSWANSKNRWLRRAAAVSFIPTPKNKLRDIFWVARKLLQDKDDLVQKGYGWMLKCTAENHQKEVFAFVMKNKKEMKRTALRYAIEKMPKGLKQRAME